MFEPPSSPEGDTELLWLILALLTYLSSLIFGTPTPLLPQATPKPLIEQFWIHFRSKDTQGSFNSLP